MSEIGAPLDSGQTSGCGLVHGTWNIDDHTNGPMAIQSCTLTRGHWNFKKNKHLQPIIVIHILMIRPSQDMQLITFPNWDWTDWTQIHLGTKHIFKQKQYFGITSIWEQQTITQKNKKDTKILDSNPFGNNKLPKTKHKFHQESFGIFRLLSFNRHCHGFVKIKVFTLTFRQDWWPCESPTYKTHHQFITNGG